VRHEGTPFDVAVADLEWVLGTGAGRHDEECREAWDHRTMSLDAHLRLDDAHAHDGTDIHNGFF
jgi:hypothetical protein